MNALSSHDALSAHGVLSAHNRFLFGFLIPLMLSLPSLVAAPVEWAVKDAPFRALIQLQQAPKYSEAGVCIELPSFGASRSNLADVQLFDSKGNSQQVYALWNGVGEKAILVADHLDPQTDYFLFFGGNPAPLLENWKPRLGLFLETRRLPPNAKLDNSQEMETNWRSAPAVDGADFAETIFRAGNPFGNNADYSSHYEGWLVTPEGGNLILYTLSSDASFVLVDGKPELEWPGIHSGYANLQTVRKQSVPCNMGFTRIAYYQAKVGEGESGAVLGWEKNGRFETIPQEAWVHPGTSRIVKIEDERGWPVPLVSVKCNSFIGYASYWLYDVECSVEESIPPGWTAEWHFEDGAIFTGPKCRRVLIGPKPQFVTLILMHDNNITKGVRRVLFPEGLNEVSINNHGNLELYLSLIDTETPSQLSLASLHAMLPLLFDFADAGRSGRVALAWLLKGPSPDDPLWMPAQTTAILFLAQNDPQKALGELRGIDPIVRKKYDRELSLLELDLLVFYLRDSSAVLVANRIISEIHDLESVALAKIRIGDLYRLTDHFQEAAQSYQSIQKDISDQTGGRKIPAQDSAYSMTIEKLLTGGYRSQAKEKLREWEIRHPMAKFDTYFLLLRARMLNSYGRWVEALMELDSFKKIQPESPYEIDADFYSAEALHALGKKEEALKLWSLISSKYPHHKLAIPSRELLLKP